MSFFFKSESQDNLQYDDTAFMHFAMAVATATIVLFCWLIVRDIQSNQKKNIKMVQKLPHFNDKLSRTNKMETSYFAKRSFWIKLMMIVVAIFTGFWAYTNMGENQTMIGFDPYEILGVSMDASIL